MSIRNPYPLRTLVICLAGILAGTASGAGAAEGVQPQRAVSPLSVTKTVTPNPAVAGKPVLWSITVLNKGTTTLKNVVINENLPLGITGITARGDSYVCDIRDAKVRCLAHELPQGASMIEIRGVAPQLTSAVSAGFVVPPAKPARSPAPTPMIVEPSPEEKANLAKHAAVLAEQQAKLKALDSERTQLADKLATAQTESDKVVADRLAVVATLETTQGDLDAAKDSLAQAVAELDALKASLGAASSVANTLKQELADAKSALATSEAKRETQRNLLAAADTKATDLAVELAETRAKVTVATPLVFATDCPREATSHKWLLNNLPILLETALANPTVTNSRAFLCAQRTATHEWDFPNPGEAVAQNMLRPDETLRTHRDWVNSAFDTASIAELRDAARNGDPVALNDLGVITLVGTGVRMDMLSGEQYLVAAARLGSSTAANNLAVLFDQGYGVDRDAATATQWRRVASTMGRNSNVN